MPKLCTALLTLPLAVLLAGCGMSAQSSPIPLEGLQQVQSAPISQDGDPDPLATALANYDPPSLTYPKLGSQLDRMAAADAERQSQDAHDDGADKPPVPPPVPVTIHLSENVDRVVEFLEDNGVDPLRVTGDTIWADVPVSLLGELSGQPGVLRVREVQRPFTP